MSSTRYAKEGSPMRQEKFCSSPEFERGLRANLVAKKCDLLSSPADKELLFWLQAMSHKEGGLSHLVADLRVRYPERAAKMNDGGSLYGISLSVNNQELERFLMEL